GLAWALPSPLVYALYLAINARLLRRHPPLVGAFGLFAGMALTFGAAAGFVGLDIPESSAGWLLLVFIALGPGALTMTLFSYSVPTRQTSGSSRTPPPSSWMRRVSIMRGLRPASTPVMSSVSAPVSFRVWRLTPSRNCNGRTPMPTRFERWIRSKLSTITALT